jgi:uncharacterized C2H2 Zn-finger protein
VGVPASSLVIWVNNSFRGYIRTVRKWHILHAHTLRYKKSKQLKCDRCTMVFIREAHIIRHCAIVHNDKWARGCPVCGRKFRSSYGLRYHVQHAHGDYDPSLQAAASDEDCVSGECRAWFEVNSCLQNEHRNYIMSVRKLIVVIATSNKPVFLCRTCARTYTSSKRCASHEQLCTAATKQTIIDMGKHELNTFCAHAFVLLQTRHYSTTRHRESYEYTQINVHK